MKTITVPEYGVWTEEYGEKWEEAFVVGDGVVGGMLFGEPICTQLVLNAPDFFLKGNPMDELPELAPFLEEFRKRIQQKGYEEAILYWEQKAIELGYPGLTMSDPFHPLMQIEWKEQATSVYSGSFRKITDFEHGFVAEQFLDQDKKQHQKRLFLSAEHELVLVMESEAPFSGQLSIQDFHQQRLQQTLHMEGNSWAQHNRYINGTGYFTAGKIETDGKIRTGDEGFLIQHATKVVVRITLDQQPASVTSDIEKTFQDSCRNWKQRYNHTRLELTEKEERLRSIDQIILEMEQTGKIPLVLYEKLYAASRYVLLACSGTSIPNLQGIWTGTFQPAWSGDYTFDTNVQLAISSFARLGMFQELRAVFQRLEEYFPDFEENARSYYGCRGYLVPAHASTTAKHVHWNQEWPLITWTAGAAWLAHFYAEYTSYSGDQALLREKAIPFYEKTILFYEDFLLREEEGTFLFRPSYSPENGMGDNAVLDVAALKETIQHLIQAYELLGEEVPSKYRSLIEHLPDYAVNAEGIFKEWIDPQKEENYNHRHFSQFYPLFESREILQSENPQTWEAIEKAFVKKMEAWVMNPKSGNTSSHGRMHAAMCAISLGRTADLERSLEEFLYNRAYFNSLITAHYNHQEVFNVDANGALPRIYQDALLYVPKEGVLNLFQAVPKWLTKGKLKGVRLPGQIEVVFFKWDWFAAEFELQLVAGRNTNWEINFPSTVLSQATGVQTRKMTLELKRNSVEMLTHLHF